MKLALSSINYSLFDYEAKTCELLIISGSVNTYKRLIFLEFLHSVHSDFFQDVSSNLSIFSSKELQRVDKVSATLSADSNNTISIVELDCLCMLCTRRHPKDSCTATIRVLQLHWWQFSRLWSSCKEKLPQSERILVHTFKFILLRVLKVVLTCVLFAKSRQFL